MISELEKVKNVWGDIKNLLSVPHTEKQYKFLLKAMDELIDEVGDNQKHKLAPLLETIGNLIDDYEIRNFQELDSDPIETLKFLMKENNLTQKDLEDIGSQGVISEILNRKRNLNINQIKKLSQKFNVSPSVFI
ncbi:MAG: helix-turn-helix domain-containing protein [Leptospiraceae bacterium]|nr:helix-turn-helix domain-containing protein [Leptospiraceae bacterium]